MTSKITKISLSLSTAGYIRRRLLELLRAAEVQTSGQNRDAQMTKQTKTKKKEKGPSKGAVIAKTEVGFA